MEERVYKLERDLQRAVLERNGYVEQNEKLCSTVHELILLMGNLSKKQMADTSFL